ncbi:MAG: DNA repair protein RecO [Myxococcota bacterium]
MAAAENSLAVSQRSGSTRAQPRLPQHDEAIVTSLVRYGESDCIARLLCKHLGRVHAFVPRGLQPSKRRGAALQAPALAAVAIRTSNNGGLARLVQADVRSPTHLLSRSLRGFGLACYVAELTESLLAEGEIAAPFFGVLEQTMRRIVTETEYGRLARAFELKLLRFCGELPQLEHATDNPAAPATAYHPHRGHVLARRQQGCLPFSENARQLACLLTTLPIDQPDQLPGCDSQTLRMVASLVTSRLRQCGVKPTRSAAFLKEVCG